MRTHTRTHTLQVGCLGYKFTTRVRRRSSGSRLSLPPPKKKKKLSGGHPGGEMTDSDSIGYQLGCSRCEWHKKEKKKKKKKAREREISARYNNPTQRGASKRCSPDCARRRRERARLQLRLLRQLSRSRSTFHMHIQTRARIHALHCVFPRGINRFPTGQTATVWFFFWRKGLSFALQSPDALFRWPQEGDRASW